MNIQNLSVFATCFSIAALTVVAMPSVVLAEPGVRLKGDYDFAGIEPSGVRAKPNAHRLVPPSSEEEYIIAGDLGDRSKCAADPACTEYSVTLNTSVGPVRLYIQKGKPQKQQPKKPLPQAELYNTAFQSGRAKFQQAA